MKKRGSRQIKRLKFQIKQTFCKNENLLLLLQKFVKLESAPQPSNKDFSLSHNTIQFQDKLLKCIEPKTDNYMIVATVWVERYTTIVFVREKFKIHQSTCQNIIQRRRKNHSTTLYNSIEIIILEIIIHFINLYTVRKTGKYNSF